jgi:alpha-galactosidase
MGKQGDRVRADGPFEVWMRPLANKETAVALFNRGESDDAMTLSFKELKLPENLMARDLWTHKDLGKLHGGYTAVVPHHGVLMLRLSEAKN